MPAGSEGPKTSTGWPVRLGLAAAIALALGLMIWGVLAQRGYAVLPPGDSAPALVPTVVDTFPAETPAELEHLLRRHLPGDVVPLADGTEVRLVPELSGLLLGITLLGALAVWAVCALALAPRIRRPGIADLLVSLLLVALGIGIGGTTVPHHAGEAALSIVFLVAASLMGPFFVRFSLAFPHPRLERRSAHRTGAVLLVLGVSVAAWTVWAWHRAVTLPGATGVSAMEVPSDSLYVLLAVCLALACFHLYRSSRTARLDRERRQARWILWGLAIGAAPYVLFRALPRALFDTEAPWPPAVDRTIEMTIPLAFAIAVVRERFLDIDVIIRRSIVYTLLALAGAGLFFGTALLLADVVFDELGLPDAWSPWAWAIAGALTGLLYRPARRAIGRWVDRTVFRLQHVQEEALAQLDRDLGAVRGQAGAAQRLLAFLDGALRPEAALVLVNDGDPASDSWKRAGTLAPDEEHLWEASSNGPALLASPGSTGAPEVEHAEFPEKLLAAGVRLVQPVRAKDTLLGVLVVGDKANGRHYVSEDLHALQAAATRAAGGLERLLLVQQAAEEATQRRALADLAREKTKFFARIAHDLRTPITAVKLLTQNLLDELPGPLTDRQRQYLDGVGAAAEQLTRLVANLVDLGRLDLEAPQPPPESVDLAAVVREATSALIGIAGERGASIQLSLDADTPPIRGRKEAAFQIVINLADNALKYTAPETAVEIALGHHDDDGSVLLSVRDHGPGLPPDSDGLFALFAQGPESPHAKAQGFGIGLHIVRSWTESLGGSVSAQNVSGGGARFTCRLPIWSGEETR